MVMLAFALLREKLELMNGNNSAKKLGRVIEELEAAQSDALEILDRFIGYQKVFAEKARLLEGEKWCVTGQLTVRKSFVNGANPQIFEVNDPEGFVENLHVEVESVKLIGETALKRCRLNGIALDGTDDYIAGYIEPGGLVISPPEA